MKKILYIAYGCEPYTGSEQGVGWNWAIGLSKHAKLTVITRANNKPVIDKWLQNNKANIDFKYFDLKDWQKKFKKADKGLYLYYYLWRKGVERLCSKMDLSQYDLIWDTNFGNVFLPTDIYKYNNTSVIGPVSYGIVVDRSFSCRYSFSQRVKYYIKRTLFNIDFLARKAFKCDKIICAAPWLYDNMPEERKRSSKVVIHNGINIGEIDEVGNGDRLLDTKKLNLVCIGRMVGIKEFEIAIKSMISHKDKHDIKLHVIGWGEEKKKLKNLVVQEGLCDSVKFYDRMGHEEVISFLKQSDMLIMPSVSEVLSTMAMEAMACRCLPVLQDIPCHTLLADESCSIKVKVDNPEDAVKGFSQAIARCYNDKEMLKRLSDNARDRAVNFFDWSCREKDYKEVIDFCLEEE